LDLLLGGVLGTLIGFVVFVLNAPGKVLSGWCCEAFIVLPLRQLWVTIRGGG
jgi:hypothetical protein